MVAKVTRVGGGDMFVLKGLEEEQSVSCLCYNLKMYPFLTNSDMALSVILIMVT